jgi:hypothetical protein
MHLCVQGGQNGQKTMVLPSADQTTYIDTRFRLSKKIKKLERPSLAADGNTNIYSSCLTRAFCQFLFRHSPSTHFKCKSIIRRFFTLFNDLNVLARNGLLVHNRSPLLSSLQQFVFCPRLFFFNWRGSTHYRILREPP